MRSTLRKRLFHLALLEQFLENLYRMKHDSLAFMRDAAARGDLREAEEFAEYVERIESMIEQRGGDPDASAPGERGRKFA